MTERAGDGCLTVAVHDIAASTATASRSWIDLLSGLGIPLTLKLVPGPYRGPDLTAEPALVDAVAGAATSGHELVLHGWDHTAPTAPTAGRCAAARRVVGRMAGRGCEEFWRLDDAAAAARIDRGRRLLGDLGLEPTGFTPPGWLASPAANSAVARSGLAWRSDHRGVIDLRTGRRVLSPALCWRGGASSDGLAAWAVERTALRLARSGRPVRLAVHPVDVTDAGLVQRTVALVESIRAIGARPATMSELLAPAVAA